MELSMSEVFLMSWCAMSTALAVYMFDRVKFYREHGKEVSLLLAELATGEVKAITDNSGYTIVENDSIKMSFRKVNN